jgi:hypothetical protein
VLPLSCHHDTVKPLICHQFLFFTVISGLTHFHHRSANGGSSHHSLICPSFTVSAHGGGVDAARVGVVPVEGGERATIVIVADAVQLTALPSESSRGGVTLKSCAPRGALTPWRSSPLRGALAWARQQGRLAHPRQVVVGGVVVAHREGVGIRGEHAHRLHRLPPRLPVHAVPR